MNFAVGAIFKNEDAYLLEWLAFHKVVGFSHFFIADNASTDMTRQLLNALAEHEPITVLDAPDIEGKRPQLDAYNALCKIGSDGVDAVAFIDSDEFIVPMNGDETVVSVLSELFADDDVGGVALNWACFGSSDLKFWDEGLVIERFLKRSMQTFPVNQHYKAVVRPSYVDHWDTPHHAALKRGRYVDTAGRDLIYRPTVKNSLSHEVLWDKVRINHYVVKSLEEFLTRKSPKGSASKAGRVKHRRYFELHDKNNNASDEMLRFVPAVKEEIARLEALVAPILDKPEQRAGSTFKHWLSSIKSGIMRD